MFTHKFHKKILLFISLTFSLNVLAFESNESLQVNSNIQNSCSISSEDINWGTWYFTEGNIGIKSFIKVLCNNSAVYTIGGSEHGGSWPYQGSPTSTWAYVIKMNGSKNNNEDWLAYRIHVGHDVDANNYNTQTNKILGMGGIVGSKNTKTIQISSIGTGQPQLHPITGVLYGNDTPTSKRFTAVTPDTYSDTFTLFLSY